MACKVSVWPAWTVKLPPSCAVVYFAPNSNKYFFIVVAVKFGKRPRKEITRYYRFTTFIRIVCV